MPKQVFTAADITVGVNAVMTLAAADLSASVIPKSDAWFALNDSDKISLLMWGWIKLSMLKFCIDGYEWVDADGKSKNGFCLSELSVTDFAGLPATFLSALGIASGMTAMSDTDCDNAEIQARDNVLSSKTGDISVTYRLASPVSYKLPKAAMELLSQYLCDKTVSLKRTR